MSAGTTTNELTAEYAEIYCRVFVRRYKDSDLVFDRYEREIRENCELISTVRSEHLSPISLAAKDADESSGFFLHHDPEQGWCRLVRTRIYKIAARDKTLAEFVAMQDFAVAVRLITETIYDVEAR